MLETSIFKLRSGHYRIMNIHNFTGAGRRTETLKELFCSTPSFTSGIEGYSKCLSALNIFLSITAFLGNTLILVALRKESSLHPPSKLLLCCLAATDLCVGLFAEPVIVVYLLSLAYKHWNLCRFTMVLSSVVNYMLCSVSLLTMTAISVDRLLALSLGLRYRQVVTLKRTYLVVATFWVMAIVIAALYIVDPRITVWYGRIGMPLCITVSIASFTRIFYALSRHHIQVQDHVQQQQQQPQLSHIIPLNIARYRKAVYSALWVQLTLVVCYLPHFIVIALPSNTGQLSSHFLSWGITGVLVYFSSSLNPFLYCWKISEVRQAVKQTIRQVLCCPWS